MTPDGWRMAPLSEVAHVNPPRPLQRGAPAPFVDMASLPVDRPTVGGVTVREFTGSGSRFRNGDTLFARITPCAENGKSALVDLLPDGAVGFGSTEFIVLGPREGGLVAEYLYYVATSAPVRSYAISKMEGSSGRQRVPARVFSEITVGVPPPDEQHQIAATLQAVDDALVAGEAVVEQLLTARAALTEDLLHRGPPEARHAVRDSEVGPVPSGWDLVRLGDLIEDGPTNGLYRPQHDYGSGVPIIRIDAFSNGDVVDVTQLKRLRISDKDARPYLLQPSDIVINRVNSLSHLAKVGFVGRVDEDTVFESNMMRLRLNGARCSPRFGFLVLASPLARSQLLRHAKQAIAQASINQQDVKGVLVPLPPLAEQHAIVDAVGAVTDRLDAERAVVAERRLLKAALADVLLSGRVRVRDAA